MTEPTKTPASNYNTPLGRFASAQPSGRKVFKVDDEGVDEFSDYPAIPQQEELSRPARIDPRVVAGMRKGNVSQAVDADVKSTIEVLLGLGRSYRDVTIDDVTFTLRTLSPKEILDIIIESVVANPNMSDLVKGAIGGFSNRNLTLSHSLYRINQQDWRAVLKTKNPAEKLQVIENMDEMVLDHLYSQYTEMLKEHKLKFSNVEEVTEEIKK
jgi:hypothetical protein